MFKIGDFSRLSRVSVKALRHYDDMGLLKPAQVDEETGYRYYAVEQLTHLNRMLALKDLGFSLEQIARLLAQGLSPSEMRGMLRLRQQEIQQHVEEEQTRLQRVEARLRQMEQEGRPSRFDIRLKQVEAEPIASLRAIIPTYFDIEALFLELYTEVYRANLRPDGPATIIWHDKEHQEQDIDTEVAVPIAAFPTVEAAGCGKVCMRVLPAATVVSLVHQGNETIEEAFHALLKWIAVNHYQIAAPSRVRVMYWKPDIRPEEFVNEIQIPVERTQKD